MLGVEDSRSNRHIIPARRRPLTEWAEGGRAVRVPTPDGMAMGVCVRAAWSQAHAAWVPRGWRAEAHSPAVAHTWGLRGVRLYY
eukprot:5206935-Prymnesium_polylepis.1